MALKGTHANAYSKKNSKGIWQRNHVYAVQGTAKELDAYNAFQAKREQAVGRDFPKDEAGNYLYYVTENKFAGVFGDAQISLKINPFSGNVSVDRDNQRNTENREDYLMMRQNAARIAAEIAMGITAKVGTVAAPAQAPVETASTAASDKTFAVVETLQGAGTETLAD